MSSPQPAPDLRTGRSRRNENPGHTRQFFACRMETGNSTTEPTSACGRADPHASVYRAYALLVITTAGNHITAIARTGQCVLNLAHSALVPAVDRLALLTGSQTVPAHKLAKDYRHEGDKFQAAGLSPLPSDQVCPPRVAECLVHLEATVNRIHPFGEPGSGVVAVDVEVVRVHIEEDLLMPGSTRYIDPDKWDPLIMKFLEFYGESRSLHPSRLAGGWGAPKLERACRRLPQLNRPLTASRWNHRLAAGQSRLTM